MHSPDMINVSRSTPTALNACFPSKVCISLDSRPERWQHMQEKFAQHAIGPVERFPALDGQTLPIPPTWELSPGAYGCLQSHLAVIRRARAQSVPHVLIFEDDVVFASDCNTRFASAIAHVPADWDMLFLGAGHLEDPVVVAPQVVRLRSTYSAYAYALRVSVYDAVIAWHSTSKRQVDTSYRQLQSIYHCYGFYPNLAWVEPGYSDTQERHTTYWDLQESLVIAGASMDRILHDTVAILRHHNPTAAPTRTRNLHFVLHQYAQGLPGMTILVVECGERPSLDPSAFPANCHYAFYSTAKYLQPGLLYSLADAPWQAHKHYFVWADGDLYVDAWDIRAGLRLCQQYDVVSPVRDIIDLSVEDTHKLLRGVKRVNMAGYRGQPKTSLCSGCCIFTATRWQKIKTWGEAAGSGEAALSRYVQQGLRVYENAGWAARLFSE
jgi:glycosyl transferase, family 25